MRNHYLIISESEKNRILSLHKLLNEGVLKTITFKGVVIDEVTKIPVENVEVFIIDRNKGKAIDGATTKTDIKGNFNLTADLDSETSYYIKFVPNIEKNEHDSFSLDITDYETENQTDFKILLKSKAKTFEGTTIKDVKGSQNVFFITEVPLNIVDTDNNPVSDVKIKSFMGVNQENIKTDEKGNAKIFLNHTAEDKEFTKKTENGDVVKDTNPEQEKKDVNVEIKKNKYKLIEEINIYSPNKYLDLISFKGKKDGKEFDIYFFCNLKKVKLNLNDDNDFVGVINEYDSSKSKGFVFHKIEEMGFTEVRLVDMFGLLGGFKKIAKNLPVSLFSNYGTQNETKTIELETFLDIQIEVVNKNNNRIPNAKVDVYTDKQKTNLITTEYTDEEGIINTKVNLLDTESEDDDLSNKSKIWLEITKKGYDDYFQNFSVSRDNFIISASLTDFSYTPDVVNTDYKKETTFFRFVGKNSYDIKGQLDGDYDMAEKRAKNDALMQFLKSSKKYKDNKKLIEALSYKIPNGGKVVYKRKYSNGYYAIVEMSRRELNRFVKSFVKANTKENENQKIEFFNFNFTNTLKSLNEEFPGSVIAVFYYVDYKYISELEKNKSVVERLNGGNFSLKVNENTPDKSAIATFFNFTTTNKIAIVDANQNILLNQTIYSNNDINFVAEKINKLLTK